MPIYIKENQDKSYFYLCGIRPIREVRLGDGITLMPATSTPTPDDMIDSIMKSNHASEMELGILIATLRMTTAQIKIEGAIGKELAMKTWNAQQICVLISAILNCDLAWYFQADRPGEMFSANTDIHIIMENVYKIPNECIEVSYEKCSFLETRIEKACKLAEVNEKFYLATNAMWSYRLNFMPAIRISVIWSGIEALFMVDRNIKNTIAIMSSRFIYGNDDMIEDIKTLEENQNAFVEACRDGKMTSLFNHSDYLIIERLLNFHEYDIAELYVTKHEKAGEKSFRIKKYKAIILQGKKNDVEALKWYRLAFEDNGTDEFVIDSLLTLSLMNKRKVSKEVLDAAIKVDTSRLHMLVAACYLNDGDISRAKSENIRAILMSGENYNPAFGQYISISTFIQSNEVITITGIEANTAACCNMANGSQCWLCVYKDCILPTSPYVWNNDYHVHIDDAARFGFLRKHTGDQITIDNALYVITEIMPLDCYLFRTCTAKMIQNGFAKELSIPVKNGKMDSSAFAEMIVQSTPDERQSVDWLEQYNNIQDVPLPLYMYKGFTRFTYFQFVDMILSSHDYFVRQMVHVSKPAEKYVISFSALVALYKAGYPADRISEAGGTIMESVLVQADADVAEVIKEYNRDTVASLGVIDGKLFINQVDETGKDYWLKEAGGFKKYCEAIPTVTSDQDLSGEFFGGFDSKELFGICDYDAIAFVQHNEEYSLVIIEAILASLSQNDLINLSVISVSDWLIRHQIDDTRLIGYLQSLLDEGCLMSITKDVIDYMSSEASKKDSDSKQRMYLMWDDLLGKVDNFPDKQKAVFIQAVSEVFALFEDEARNIDKGILHILTTNILLLRKQKIEMFIDASGCLSFSLVNIESEELEDK